MKNLYKNAPPDKINRLERTFEQFGIKSNPLVGETLLRLENYIENSNSCALPKDNPGKALFNMYKYYYLLAG